MRFHVFLSGVLIMAFELAIGRYLTPFYGDSVTVWGTIIGVLLCALALGYYVGGFLADRYSFSFGPLFLIYSVWCLLAPLIVNGLVRFHVFFVSVVLLLIPMFLLGIIAPCALKQSTKNLKELGASSGELYALGTLGSIVGTFGTVFFLFQIFAIDMVFFILAACSLLGVCFSRGLWRYSAIPAIILLIILWPSSPESVFPSSYGEISVIDNGLTRRMLINGGDMGEINVSDPLVLLPYWDYLYCMEAPFLMADVLQNPSVFTIGLGPGIYQSRISSLYNAQVDAIEVNPVVVRVAREYFDYSLDATIADGRVELDSRDELFDVIALDAMHYDNVSYQVPMHLVSKEFFSLVESRLAPDGYLVIHIPGGPTKEIVSDVGTTIQTVFPEMQHYDCLGGQVFVAKMNTFTTPVELEKYVYSSQQEGIVISDKQFPLEYS